MIVEIPGTNVKYNEEYTLQQIRPYIVEFMPEFVKDYDYLCGMVARSIDRYVTSAIFITIGEHFKSKFGQQKSKWKEDQVKKIDRLNHMFRKGFDEFGNLNPDVDDPLTVVAKNLSKALTEALNNPQLQTQSSSHKLVQNTNQETKKGNLKN